LALSFLNFFDRTDSVVTDKLVRNEKFASEIFFHEVSPDVYAAVRKTLRDVAGSLTGAFNRRDQTNAEIFLQPPVSATS